MREWPCLKRCEQWGTSAEGLSDSLIVGVGAVLGKDEGYLR